jgi:hypothetical protein
MHLPCIFRTIAYRIYVTASSPRNVITTTLSTNFMVLAPPKSRRCITFIKELLRIEEGMQRTEDRGQNAICLYAAG